MRREVTVAVRTPRCKTPGHENRDAVCRGVCRSCYQSAWILVNDGAVQWKQLEERGKVEATTSTKEWLLS